MRDSGIMERDGIEKAGSSPDIGAKTRFTSPLLINSASQRRSLFTRPSKDDSARRINSGAPTHARAASSNDTKIPRPAQRRPFTLSDAYRMAEEEEVAQGSPSPAPRLWRSRRESNEKKVTNGRPATSASDSRRPGLSGKSLESGHDGGPEDLNLQSQPSDTSDGAFDAKLRQYELEQAGSENPVRHSNGLSTRSKLRTKIVETGRELTRSTGRSSLDGSSSPWATKSPANNTWLSRRLSGRKQDPSNPSPARDSADRAQADDILQDKPSQPGTIPSDPQSPDTSFAWLADADFTAGDLQVSGSPPVTIGRSNTKIDQIRALEATINERFSESPQRRQRNTRIDEIRALEVQASLRYPDRPAEPHEAVNGAQPETAESNDRAPRSPPLSRSNSKMDELRSREIESLSRRALTSARLDELREMKVESTSRSPSPDMARKSSKEPLRAFSPLGDRLRRQKNEGPAIAAEPQENPTTQSSKLSHARRSLDRSPANAASTGIVGGGPGSSRTNPPPTDRARDVLRRMAVVTNTSPAPESREVTDGDALLAPGREVEAGTKQKRLGSGAKGDAKPTVGFAMLERSSSIESGLAKRTSFAHSDSDPTERIEGEMKLFAPLENQSERGSLRAPSPEPEREESEETPRPAKIDPLTQATPRVTGAFVETPATVKVEKSKDSATALATGSRTTRLQTDGVGRLRTDANAHPSLSFPGEETGSTAVRQKKRSQSTVKDRLLGRPPLPSARRRARSLSGGRVPLINSARPPTVKDDLLEIQRANQIDDSTLDDIADLLGDQDRRDTGLGSRKTKSEDGSSKLDREEELKAYDRMSRSLETGLLGIRTAKQGIGRLEKKVSHADVKGHTPSTPSDSSTPSDNSTPSDSLEPASSLSCPDCHGTHPSAHTALTYVHLPLPRLWHRQPKFRFTLFGLVLFLVSLWYIAESCMCFWYCKPEYCYPGTPCEWSPDDPVWGYAIPVKLDQWVGGGHGRELARRLGPDVADWLADLWDAATGTDITAVDTSRYNWEQKRQHRRRLAKKGLVKRFVEPPEDKAMYSAWSAVRKARERAQSAQEMGYDLEEDESMTGDDKL